MPFKIRVKKEAAEQVYVAHWSESMAKWVAANLKSVVTVIGVLVVAGIAFLAVNYMTLGDEDKASVLETEASSLLHDPLPLPEPIEEGEDPPEVMTRKERFQKSAELYNEIMEKYPSTATAAVAQYESGNVYFELEEFDLAEERYLSFIRTYPEKKELVSIIQLKLGYLQQRKGDAQAGRDYFRALYESESAWNRDQAGFELARSLEMAGKEEEAKKIYELLSENFAQSPWGVEAEARFIFLSPPAETDSSSGDKTTDEMKEEETGPPGEPEGE